MAWKVKLLDVNGIIYLVEIKLCNNEKELIKLKQKRNQSVNWQIQCSLEVFGLKKARLYIVGMDKVFSMDSLHVYSIIEYDYEGYLSLFQNEIISTYVNKICVPWIKLNFNLSLKKSEKDFFKISLRNFGSNSNTVNDSTLTIEDLRVDRIKLNKTDHVCYKEYSDYDYSYPLFKII